MLLDKEQEKCKDQVQDEGIILAKLIPFAPIDIIAPNPVPETIVSVSIKLISVQHIAERGNEVGNDFTLELTISDGGQNKISKFGSADVNIPNGSFFNANEFLPIRNYSSLSSTKIKFDFRAETDFLSGIFIGETVGDDALSPGVNLFVVPVVLESAGLKSTLIFRGRVDVTVLNGTDI